MRAFQLITAQKPPELREVPVPEPGPGQYLVKVGCGRRNLRDQQLLRGELPTAVIAANDLSAIALLDIMIRAGLRVPQDLSVVGYDDSRFAKLPGVDLTSVRQDIPGMAKLAVQSVVERLERPDREPKNLARAPHLVVRGTTSPPRSGAVPLG